MGKRRIIGWGISRKVDMIKQFRQIIDAHYQKYHDSCSPSLIEMLLKLHGRVPLDYYDLQDQYQNQNVGLIHFRDQKIRGLHIHCHDESKGQSFLDHLQELWKEGQIVALYCCDKNDFLLRHGWLVSDVREGQIHLLSKYSEEGNGEGKITATETFPLTGQGAIQITDLIYGQIVSP